MGRQVESTRREDGERVCKRGCKGKQLLPHRPRGLKISASLTCFNPYSCQEGPTTVEGYVSELPCFGSQHIMLDAECPSIDAGSTASILSFDDSGLSFIS
jgi:hypothetical protein